MTGTSQLQPLQLDLVDGWEIKGACKYWCPSTELPRGARRRRKPLKETNEALSDVQRVSFSPCFTLLYDREAFTDTEAPLTSGSSTSQTFPFHQISCSSFHFWLTFGLGSPPMWSRGALSSLSPKMDLRYWAMTSCCFLEQWFSSDRITGYADTWWKIMKPESKLWCNPYFQSLASTWMICAALWAQSEGYPPDTPQRVAHIKEG